MDSRPSIRSPYEREPSFRRAGAASTVVAFAILSGVMFGRGSASGSPRQTVSLGVYRGAGCDGIAALPQFVRWFGRAPDRGLDFFSQESWEELEKSAEWEIRCWHEAGHPAMTFSLPMLPLTAPDKMKEGAAGEYDGVFRKVAETLVKYGYGDAIIRIGWEFNGDWTPWAAAGRERDYIAYWRRIVTVMRGVPGTAFKFDWSVANASTKQRAEDAYPGDDWVDIIGLDVYNQSWSWFIRTPEKRWDELSRGRHRLLWHRNFAAAHRKPMSFPEWGTGTRPDGHGAGDDPHFIRKMAAWIAANRVVYHNYWDYHAPDYDAELSDGRQPKAADAFLAVFGSGPKQAVKKAAP